MDHSYRHQHTREDEGITVSGGSRCFCVKVVGCASLPLCSHVAVTVLTLHLEGLVLTCVVDAACLVLLRL